jgi:hypothetical protein
VLVTGGIAAMSMLGAMPASAKITELKFHVVTTQFDNVPYMEMTHDGKTYNWTSQDKNFNVRTKVLVKSIGNRFSNAGIIVTRTNASLWKMPSHKTFKYEKLETTAIGKAFLSPFKNDARALCDVFGGDKKNIRDMEIGLRMWAESVNGGPSVKGIMPVRVVCMPRKQPDRMPVAFKVTDVKLYTIPAKPACGKPIRLVTEIRSNKSGKVDFTLHRRDGEKQQVSITTEQTAKGYAKRWSKEYVYNNSIRREYLVVVNGHPLSTDWVPVDVKCGVGTDAEMPGDLAN